MIEKKVIAKHIETHYKMFGKGKPLLILHGWPSSSEKWIGIGKELAEHGFLVVIPDLPGFGSTPAPATPWSQGDYVQWMQEFVDALPEFKKEFYLLGHSFGGSLSARFAIKYNQRLEKLFLVAASCIRKKTLPKDVSSRISKIVKKLSFIPYYRLIRKAMYKFVFKKSDYANIEGVMKETYLKVIADDSSQKLYFIKVPTIILWGDKDTSTPIDDARFINKKIQNSKLIIIPGVGHSVQLEAPEILIQKILENV